MNLYEGFCLEETVLSFREMKVKLELIEDD